MKAEYNEEMLEQEAINKYLNMIANDYGGELARIFQEKYINKDKEIERLNNIINKFDKWLLGEQMMFYKGSDNERLIRYGETKNKWLELKGSDK